LPICGLQGGGYCHELTGKGSGRTSESFDPVARGQEGEEKEENVSVDLTDLKQISIGAVVAKDFD